MKSEEIKLELEAGDKLVHRINKQSFFVINDDGKKVYLLPSSSILEYPIDRLLNDFELVEKYSKNNEDKIK